MNFTLRGAEIECVKRLAKNFEEGKTRWQGADFEALGLTPENAIPVLKTMEDLGAIDNVTHTMPNGSFRHFAITSTAVQIARQIEEQESKSPEAPDVVQQTIDQFRRHPVMGRIIFWGIAVGAIITAISSVITLCEKVVGWFK